MTDRPTQGQMKSLLSLLLLTGCSVLGSKPATVACQAADTYYTVRVIEEGGRETNPFMPKSRDGIIAVKVLITSLLLWFHDDIGPQANTAINFITCGAAAISRKALKEQREINRQATNQ